jgi:DNA-binding NtrC family response regulator
MIENKKRSLRILLIDCDEKFLKISRHCLAVHDHFEIETAKSTEEASTKMKETKPDVIVSDLSKSNIDDFKFFESLRNVGNMTPFIMFTLEDEKEFEDKARQIGISGFISKFGDPQAVYSSLRNCILAVYENDVNI